MRITFNSGYDASLADLQRTLNQYTKYSAQVSSGLRVTKPSDDAADYASAVKDTTELGVIDSYTSAADTAESRLSVMDTVLSDLIDQVTSAQTSTTAALGSTTTETSRTALAQELEGLRDAILSDMNSTFGGTYLFSGTASLAAPYEQASDGTVSTYKGDTGAQTVDIGRGCSVQTTYTGSDLVQGSSTNDLFTTLGNLITAVQTNDQTAIETASTELQTALERLTNIQSSVGNDLDAISSQQSRLSSLKLQMQDQLSNAQDANVADAATKMEQADTAYEAGLSALSTRTQTSLLDYL
jgi:flagellar hook-associated protein 3 FlgL